MQRKMIKWKPINTLLKYKDILDIERNRSLIDKPVIMEDRIIKIDNILKDVNENTLVKVKYFNKGVLFYITGNIKKVNDNNNTKYLIHPNFFLLDFGILYGSKSNIIPVQQAYPHHPLPKNKGPAILATK